MVNKKGFNPLCMNRILSPIVGLVPMTLLSTSIAREVRYLIYNKYRTQSLRYLIYNKYRSQNLRYLVFIEKQPGNRGYSPFILYTAYTICSLPEKQ